MYLNVPLGVLLVSPRQIINSVSFGRDEDDITCVYGFDRAPKTVVQQCCRFLELLACQPIVFHLYKLNHTPFCNYHGHVRQFHCTRNTLLHKASYLLMYSANLH
jgi:hypothetical protein